MNISPSLKSVSRHIGYDQYSNILEANLVHYYSWQFLTIGGWSEISLDEVGHYGGDFSRLRPVDDPSYTAGQVWEGARKDWVWETGVIYTDTTGGTRSPLPVSGLTVNSNSITSGYTVNYPDGRIIFDTSISQTDVVQIQHSFKSVQVISTNSNLWKQIQKDSYNINNQFLQDGSGDWDILSKHRVQLPLVAIETDARGTSEGYEIGNQALQVSRDVIFYILAENKPERNNIMDIICNQSDKTIWLFNTNTVAASGAFPLGANGEKLNDNTYPVLVSENSPYRYTTTMMEDAQIANLGQVNENLYEAMVKTTFTSVL